MTQEQLHQDGGEPQDRMSPAQKTAEFLGLGPHEIVDRLIDANIVIVIAMAGTDRRVIVDDAEGFDPVGPRYNAIVREDMQPGVVWNPGARGGIRQTLLVTRRSDPQQGACVRLARVRYWGSQGRRFVRKLTLDGKVYKDREGDIARYLGLERGDRSRLQFLDGSNTLYIVRKSMDSERANVTLENFVERED